MFGCATTAEVDSLPLTVMANIEAIDNAIPVSYSFTSCSQEICNEAGLGGLKIGGKYAVVYNPNQSVNKLFDEYLSSKYLNMNEASNNKINVELLSVEEEHSSFDNGTDFFKSADDISVTYTFKMKIKVTYKNEAGEIKTYPTIAKKKITSTQKNIGSAIKSEVSKAIGLSIIRFDKFLAKNT
jgi:hypothetical protein